MVEQNLKKILSEKFDKSIKDASNAEIYSALLQLTKENIKTKGTNKGSKNLQRNGYFSFSFFGLRN